MGSTILLVEPVRATALRWWAMLQAIGSSATVGVPAGASRVTSTSNAGRTSAAWSPAVISLTPLALGLHHHLHLRRLHPRRQRRRLHLRRRLRLPLIPSAAPAAVSFASVHEAAVRLGQVLAWRPRVPAAHKVSQGRRAAVGLRAKPHCRYAHVPAAVEDQPVHALAPWARIAAVASVGAVAAAARTSATSPS